MSDDDSSLEDLLRRDEPKPDESGGPSSPPPRTQEEVEMQEAPLTPLSVLEEEEEEEAGPGDLPEEEPVDPNEDQGGGEPPPPPPRFRQDEEEQEDPILHPSTETTHVRGTDVNLQEAAATFTAFLREFRSLRISQRRQRMEANDDDDSSDDSDLSDDEEEDATTPPLYLSRLQSLLTHGVMNVNDQSRETAGDNGRASLDIDTMHLYYHNPDCQRFYHQLVAYPMELVPLMDIVVQRELERLAATMTDQELPRLQVRPYNLREVSNLRCLDPVYMESLLSIKGMIVRTSPIIPDLKLAHFSCVICGNIIQVQLDRGRIAEPRQSCPGCNTKSSYQLIHNRCAFTNKQLVRLQETPDEVPAGQTPASVVTFCYDDLVDKFSPGDKVEVTGVLRAQPVRVNPKLTKLKTIYKTYVDVIHFRIINGMETAKKDGTGAENSTSGQWSEQRVRELKELSQQPDIYDKLTASLAPSIWELDDVKKGVLCMLFGGNQRRVKKGTAEEKEREQGDNDDDDDQSRQSWLDENDDEPRNASRRSTSKLHKRGDINILLCGDPGTSKSQLLSYVNKLSARGVYTSGKGSSAVGLTASVVRDPETRDLVLESGALVLSDLGICCIDEFDKMTDTTRSVLHEAMEQQTVSIAKAGIIATLHARTSVLASANPTESRYNPSMSVVDNIQLPPTLLSRFDLIYLILDSPNVEQDRRLAQHLVGLYYETPNVVKPPMDQALLRDFIEYARENIHPEISEEASEQLIASYLEMRNPSGSVGAAGTRTISATTRQLESLIRLSEALAKMRYSNLVTRGDAREAVRLMKIATQAAATDPRTGRIDMDMIMTGRGAAAREMEEQLNVNLKELFAERRGTRMAVRDVTRQLYEISDTAIPHDQLVEALRRMEADGVIQLNERAQTIFVRTGIVR